MFTPPTNGRVVEVGVGAAEVDDEGPEEVEVAAVPGVHWL